jgi:Flp pilus assembly protein TadD
MARKSHAEAIAGYKAALGRESSTENAMRLYQALVQSGDRRAATAFVESWTRTYPRDSVAQRALADAYGREGNPAGARAAYEQVLRLEGDDAAVLNNLANILASQGDKRALELAERAHRLAPRDAAVQDTLGWILVQQGQLDAGLRHLREARLRAPENPEIRYHLAAALVRFGRREEARRELEPALREGIAFEGRAEAQKLSQELAGR